MVAAQSDILELELDFTEYDKLREDEDAARRAVAVTVLDEDLLTREWKPLRFHAPQVDFEFSEARFNVVPAGRRSGKTLRAKRRLVRKAVAYTGDEDSRFIAAAPTHQQAIRIYWSHLKKLAPPWMVTDVSESDHIITLNNGAMIQVMGLDVPERVEGSPVAHILLDEYGNMKERAWGENIRPALADSGGSADLIGVPEGRNHYYQKFLDAQERYFKAVREGKPIRWRVFQWPSSDILSLEEIEEMKRDMDPLTFDQECNASFINFQGRAYYGFETRTHADRPLTQFYNPDLDLIFCFDFNVDPGPAVVCQEFEAGTIEGCPEFTGIIGEVYIQSNSNTERVCRQLLDTWGTHRGRVLCYGDATGGARGSAKLQGSDWDIIRSILKPIFGERLIFRVQEANPRERIRVNAVNCRVKTVDGSIHLRCDPEAAKYTVRDFEGVILKEDGSGEIQKDKESKMLTHLTDGLGYYVAKRFPVLGLKKSKVEAY